MAKVSVNPGICGLTTDITVTSPDGMNVEVKAETTCDYIKNLVEALPSIDSYTEIFAKYGEGIVAKTAAGTCKHAACPVATAILKAIEVECSLALPGDVAMKIEK